MSQETLPLFKLTWAVPSLSRMPPGQGLCLPKASSAGGFIAPHPRPTVLSPHLGLSVA